MGYLERKFREGRRMNKLLVGLVASSVLAMPSLAAQASSSTTSVADPERQVLKLEREWTAAEIKRDAATLRRILDDRFVVTFGAGEAIDKEGFIKGVIGDDTDVMLSQDLTDETVRVDRDTAVIVETDTIHGTDKGQPYTQVLRITTTYIHRHGRWSALAEQMVSKKPIADSLADEAAIRAADMAHVDAYNAGDVDTIVAGYAADAVVMPSDAPAVSGHEAIRKLFTASIASAKAAGLTESLMDYSSVVSGDLGWSTGTSREVTAAGTTVWVGKFLATWRRTDGKWLAVRDTWNDDAPSVPSK
jgi:ketosteroid isomerase-like protein